MLDFIQKGLGYGWEMTQSGWQSFQNLPQRARWSAYAAYGAVGAYELFNIYQAVMLTGDNISDYWNENNVFWGTFGAIELTGELAIDITSHLMRLAAAGAFGLASASIYDNADRLKQMINLGQVPVDAEGTEANVGSPEQQQPEPQQETQVVSHLM